MGWENYHLHVFRFRGKEYEDPDPEYPSDILDGQAGTGVVT